MSTNGRSSKSSPPSFKKTSKGNSGNRHVSEFSVLDQLPPAPKSVFGVFQHDVKVSGENETFIAQLHQRINQANSENVNRAGLENDKNEGFHLDQVIPDTEGYETLQHLPTKAHKKANYVVVEQKVDHLDEGRKFLRWHSRTSVTSLLPPVERTDGVFKEKILRESLFHNSERKRKRLPVQERSASFTIRQKAEDFIHDWIPGVTTPEGIVLVSGLAILVGTQNDVDTLEKLATAASTIIVSAVTLGIPASALSFL